MKVELVDHNASDLKVVNAARVSYGGHSDKLTKKDEGLINAMMREHHGSVFEHSTFTFRVTAPITVFREWHRHRVGHSYNEISGRYVKLQRKFHYPSPRKQHGKAMAYSFKPVNILIFSMTHVLLWIAYNFSYSMYWLLSKLVAKEVARYCLPGATMSQMYWTCNARSLMHFLSLRNDSQALFEIRLLAMQAESIFSKIMPVTQRAFVMNGRVSP